MARILGKSISGRPGYSVLRPRPQVGGGRFGRIRTLIKRNEANGLTVDNIFTAAPVGAKASLATAMTGNDNDLVIASLLEGADGNNIRYRHVVAGNNTPLSVTVSGKDITVNVGTNNVGAAISTAQAVMDIVNGTAGAGRDLVSGHRRLTRALVKVTLKAGNDGTGVVAAFAFTNLAGGVNGSDLRAGAGVPATASPGVARQQPNASPAGPAGGGRRTIRKAPNTRVVKRP